MGQRPRTDLPIDDGPLRAPLFSTAQLAALGGGFAPFLADVYWIRVVGTPVDSLDPETGPEYLYALLDRVTALDPRFEPPYHFGGLLLSLWGQRPDLSNRLLVRAEATFPENWVYPFYLGFNLFYHETDFVAAAVPMERAASLPGSPPFLARLVQRFRNTEHNREAGKELLRRMLASTNDPVIKERLIARLQAMEENNE